MADAQAEPEPRLAEIGPGEPRLVGADDCDVVISVLLVGVGGGEVCPLAVREDVWRVVHTVTVGATAGDAHGTDVPGAWLEQQEQENQAEGG